MKDNYTVYLHTVPKELNGYKRDKYYVGITCQDVKKRWNSGWGYYYQVFWTVIKKYGWNNIKHEILYEGLSKKEAEHKEMELIKYYNSRLGHDGYNATNGGEGGGGGTRDWAKPVYCIDTNKAYRTSDVAGEKLNINGNKIRHCCNANKTLKKCRHKYRSMHWVYLDDWSGLRKRPVYCVELKKIYMSVSLAEKHYFNTSVGACCSGKRKTAGRHPETNEKLHWMYLDEYLRIHDVA
ncbi:hypothetical protein [Clostridium sp.]|uniref:hypothetical protein n=1 Tax=Clostridium sp. TaxID=1506 RepID=UPI003217BE18